jgi:acyl-CoA thioesterase FadM
MKIPTPLTLYQTTVSPDWLDYNNHMTEGYYGYVFGYVSDAFIDYAGMDAEYRARTDCTIYTVETHICFLRELPAGAGLHFTTQLLGTDAKRMHVFHQMFHAEAGYLAATFESMMVHVNQEVGRVVPMPEEIQRWLGEIAVAHEGLERPVQVGRGIQMPEGGNNEL